jgi:hypothetical protein
MLASYVKGERWPRAERKRAGLYHPSMKLKRAIRASEARRRRSSCSHSRVAKKLSHIVGITDRAHRRSDRHRLPNASEVYWLLVAVMDDVGRRFVLTDRHLPSTSRDLAAPSIQNSGQIQETGRSRHEGCCATIKVRQPVNQGESRPNACHLKTPSGTWG